MKGNISRIGFREDGHFSGVFQIQGGMVTDSDLGEEATIARARTDRLGEDTAGSGVPVSGGIVDLTGGAPKLVAGDVYAEGVRGVVRATAPLPDALSLFGLQEDFPLSPDLPQGACFLYVDVWERTIAPLEDPLLADAGFHGAETALRQKTMAQIKAAPLDQLEKLGDADGPLPRIGGGLLSAKQVDAQTIVDECDPCATVVEAKQTVANALFRIEVVHVFGDPQQPDKITLAWSAENAAAIAPRGVNAEDFGRSGAVYECFSPATEMHLGVHRQGANVARSTFIETVGGNPNPASGPDNKPWPFLRRWDGVATIDFAAGTVSAKGTGSVELQSGVVKLGTSTIDAEIDFRQQATVAGDFWLIELRRYAEEAVRVVSAAPYGIRHHYCPLFRLDSNGAIEPLTDAENRRLSFPTLANLPADHVSFENKCPTRFKDAENVQEALDYLCTINASEISFDPSGCTHLYDNVDNVQDALINLCKVDFGLERYLSLFHDWGVVCGAIASFSAKTQISWTGGTILSREGNLGDVKQETRDINEIFAKDGGKYFADLAALRLAIGEGKDDICLALEIETGGKIVPHIVSSKRAFGPDNPSFLSVFEKCRKQWVHFDFDHHIGAVTDLQKKAASKIFYAAASSKIAGAQGFKATERRDAKKFVEGLREKYVDEIGDEEVAKRIEARFKSIDDKFDGLNASGAMLETFELQRYTEKYKAIRETDEERIRRCLCDALLPRCPEKGRDPNLVPIACLRLKIGGQGIEIEDVCHYCCRKQAMTWWMVQYFIAELRSDFGADLAELCCPPPKLPPFNPPPFIDPKIPWEPWIDPKWNKLDFMRDFKKGVISRAGFGDPVKPKYGIDIGGSAIDIAELHLARNGINVAEKIEVGDPEIFAKLDAKIGNVIPSKLATAGMDISPGDTVAVLTDGGVATGYIKLDAGKGRAAYDMPSKALDIAKLDYDAEAGKVLADFGEKLGAKAAELRDVESSIGVEIERRKEEAAKVAEDLARTTKERRDEAAAVTEEMRALAEKRAEINAEVRALGSDIERLRNERESLRLSVTSVSGELERVKSEHEDTKRAIAEAKTQLSDVSLAHEDAKREIAEAKTELASAKTELSDLVARHRVTIEESKAEIAKLATLTRSEVPVVAITEGNTDFAAALNARGVTTVGEMAEIPDARLVEAAREANLNVNTARRMVRLAGERLSVPIALGPHP